MATIYKICPADLWEAVVSAGVFNGMPIDVADGYIHFSTAAQAEETARRHFAGMDGLLLIAFDDAALGSDLRYEPSRGGALFPHLYAPLDPELALWVKALTRGADGAHVFPEMAR